MSECLYSLIDGTAMGVVEDKVALEVEVARLQADADAGRRFKDFCHDYLDQHGVPEGDPENQHQIEGCRIGARLDLLLAENARLAEEVMLLQQTSRAYNLGVERGSRAAAPRFQALCAENAALRAEVATGIMERVAAEALRAENAALRAQLAEAQGSESGQARRELLSQAEAANRRVREVQEALRTALALCWRCAGPLAAPEGGDE